MSDAATFQVEARDAAQSVLMAALTGLAEVVNKPDVDPELLFKAVGATKDIAQAIPKDKGDSYGNIPMFNIVIGRAGITATVEVQPTPSPAADVVDVEATTVAAMVLIPARPEQELEELVPSHKMMRAAKSVNTDMAEEIVEGYDVPTWDATFSALDNMQV